MRILKMETILEPISPRSKLERQKDLIKRMELLPAPVVINNTQYEYIRDFLPKGVVIPDTVKMAKQIPAGGHHD